MTEQNWLARTGATPAKLAVVCGLTVALVAIIWHNASGTTQPPSVRKTHQTAAPQEQVVANKGQDSSPVEEPMAKNVPRIWPKFKLENLVKNDPFTMPMWYLVAHTDDAGPPGASLARSAQVLEELKKQPAKMIMITSEDRVATIGEQSYRVGDKIEGFQVTAITTEGIVLTEIDR